MGKFFHWLTYDITTGKSLLAMGLTALLAWGVPILYTAGARYDERLAIPDFQRWEIWFALIGFVAGLVMWLLIVIKDGKRKRKKLEETRRVITS